MKLKILNSILKRSIKKHGPDHVLTLDHLKNIIALADKIDDRIKQDQEEESNRIKDELFSKHRF